MHISRDPLEKFIPKKMLSFTKQYTTLQTRFGDPGLKPVIGGGLTRSPKIVLVFMHPTGRNISTRRDWSYTPLPWIGTSQAFLFLHRLGLLDVSVLQLILSLKPDNYTYHHALTIYNNVAKHKVFIAEYVPVTTAYSKSLPNQAYNESLPLFLKLLLDLKPNLVFLLGNRVTSHFLNTLRGISDLDGKPIRVPKFRNVRFIPTYYPLGQGMRNQPKAIKTIRKFIRQETPS